MASQGPPDVTLPAALRASPPRRVPARRGAWVAPVFVAMYLAALAGFGRWAWAGAVMRSAGRGPSLGATVLAIEPYNARYRRVRLSWAEGGAAQSGSLPVPAADADALEAGESVRLWVARAPGTAPVLALTSTLPRVRSEGGVRLAFGLLFVLGSTVATWRIVRGLARERRLMRHGVAAVGSVVRTARRALTGWWYVVYEYETPQGTRQGVGPRGAQRRGYERGSPVFVLYDSARPERSMLWGIPGDARREGVAPV